MQSTKLIPTSSGSFWFTLIGRALLLGLLVGPGIAASHAATRTWTGGHASSANWNLRDNWGGTAVPANGDTLVFPSGAARLNNTNNIAALRLHSIVFDGAGGGYILRGNSISLSNGITVVTASANTLRLDSLSMSGPQTIHVAPGAGLTVFSDIALSDATLSLAAIGDLALRGAISGSGNITKTGAGQLSLSGEGANTFIGSLTIASGTLAMNKFETISFVPFTQVSRIAVPGNLVLGNGSGTVVATAQFDHQIADTGAVTINENATLHLNGHDDTLGGLTLKGGVIHTGTGTLTLGGNVASLASPDSAVINGQMVLGVSSTFSVADGSPGIDLDARANIDGGIAHLTKTGAGTMRLGGTNTYLGVTYVNGGQLNAGNDDALGTANGTTVVNAGAQLLLEHGVDTLEEHLALSGAGIGGTNAALRVAGSAAIQFGVSLDAPATINVPFGAGLSLNGVVSGTGPLTTRGEGTLELAGNSANTFTGELCIEEGVLLLSKLGGSAVQGNLIIGTANSTAIARHTRSANLDGAVTVNAGSLYDLDNNNESIDALTLNAGGDVETGTGLLTVDGNVVVNAGLALSGSTSTIDGRLGVGVGSRQFVVAETGGLMGGGTDLVVNAHVREGAIIKDGTGGISLTASNSFQGSIQVEAGEVLLTHSHALGSALQSGEILLKGQSVLALAGGIAITNRGLVIHSTNTTSGGPFQSRSGTNTWGDFVSLSLDDTMIRVATNSLFLLEGMIRGEGGLTKTGAGILTFSGGASNRYAGATRVLEGTLRLENHTWPNRAIPGPLIIGDGVGIDLVEDRTGLSQINDAAPVTILGSGWLVLQAVGDEKIGSLSGDGHVHFVGAGAGLDVGGNGGSTTFSGEISGNGSLSKSGTGTLLLTGTNTFSGDTLIHEGILVVNGEQPDSDVYVDVDGTLRGNGEVGHVAVDGTFDPGDPGQALKVASLNFIPGGIFDLDLNAASSYVGYGSVYSSGFIHLTGAILDVSLGYAPAAGDRFYFGENTGTDATTGHFVGLPEGTVIYRNHIPLQITYQGFEGAGNDIRLTVGELALRLESARVEAGNGSGLIDPDECNNLYVSIENPTGAPVTVISAHLQSLDEQIVVTHGESDYGTVPALDLRTNRTAFQIRSSSSFDCGKNARFKLVVDTAANGKFAIPVGFRTGQRGSSVVFHAPNTPAAIADDGGTMLDGIFVTNNFRVAKVRVSVHATHPSVGQLRFQLIGPGDETVSYGGTGVELITYRGGAGNNLGTSCNVRTTFDDDAASSVVSSSAPFAGAFRPENPLSEFIGASSYGHWYLLVEDNAAGSIGVVQCWSLELFPAECTDGGGGCESCLTTTSGTLDYSSPAMDQRLWRILPPTGCGDVQPCNGAVPGDHPPYRYRAHTFTNTGPDTCVTVALSTPCDAFTNILVGAACLGDFNPGSLCANLIGASDDDYVAGFNGFSFPVPAGGRFTVVVNEQNYDGPFSGCGSYSLELYGLPCPQEQPRLHIANAAGPDHVRLHWSTAYPGFVLQGRPSLGGLVIGGFTNVNTTPVVIDGHYTVTNRHDGKGNGFFRLRKP